MEEIYQLIVKYKNLHPLRFGTGIALTLVGLGLIVTFLRKRRKSDKAKGTASKPTIKTASFKTSQTTTVKPENKSIKLIFGDIDTFYQMPIYQRPYSWDKERVEQLWYDVLEAYKNNAADKTIDSNYPTWTTETISERYKWLLSETKRIFDI